MNISNIKLRNNIFLAPMAGVTDSAFRRICIGMGCGLCYTEMISAKGLFYGSKKTEDMLRIKEEEKPIAVQIFGKDPDIMADVCEKYFSDDRFCIIDINMGCPANKIVKNGEGSALMKEPELAYKIVSGIKKVSNKPVTVKFRKGYDSNHINAVEFAKMMEDAGADALTIHGRTREEMFEGKADLNIIKAVKENVKIPVIGNGNIFSPEDAKHMIEFTGCDGIMVARGALGNPWIFREINQCFKGEDVIYPKDYEKIDMCIEHLKLAVKLYGEDIGIREMRKDIAWYIKGLKNCSEIKNEVNTQLDFISVLNILLEYKDEIYNMNII